MSLETLLRDAADGDVTLQPDDVHRRVRHWQRRRRALAGLGVIVLLAAGAAGVVALTSDDGDRSIVTGPPEDRVTAAALASSPWILLGSDDSVVEAPRLQLFIDGRSREFSLVAPCASWFGTWDLYAGSRVVLDVSAYGTPSCASREGTVEADELLRRVAEVSEATIETDALTFNHGDGGVTLHRLHSLPAVTRQDLRGRWQVGNAGFVEFRAGGFLTFDGTCAGVGWSLHATHLRIQSIPTCGIRVNKVLTDLVPAGARIPLRVDGNDLYLGSQTPAVIHRLPPTTGN